MQPPQRWNQLPPCHPPALLEALDDFFDKFPDAVLGLVEIGDICRVKTVQRLLEGKHRAVSVALVEFCVEHRNTRSYQTILNMRLCARPYRGLVRVSSTANGISFFASFWLCITTRIALPASFASSCEPCVGMMTRSACEMA